MSFCLPFFLLQCVFFLFPDPSEYLQNNLMASKKYFSFNNFFFHNSQIYTGQVNRFLFLLLFFLLKVLLFMKSRFNCFRCKKKNMSKFGFQVSRRENKNPNLWPQEIDWKFGSLGGTVNTYELYMPAQNTIQLTLWIHFNKRFVSLFFFSSLFSSTKWDFSSHFIYDSSLCIH